MFCSENLRSKLGVTGKTINLPVQNLLQDQKVKTTVITDLEIDDVQEQHVIELPNVYCTKDKLPVSLKDVVANKDVAEWPYLNEVKLLDIEANDVGLLIGSNFPRATELWEVIHSQNGGPYAYRTLLGWVACGLTNRDIITSNKP